MSQKDADSRTVTTRSHRLFLRYYEKLSSVVLGAGGHNVTGLLAPGDNTVSRMFNLKQREDGYSLVANTVLLRGAVAGKMADLATVVALLALGAVARKMA